MKFEMMGYEVEARENPTGRVKYDVYGPRDAHYGLVQTARPDTFFAMNLRPGSYNCRVSLKGNYWFRRNDDGTVRPIS